MVDSWELAVVLGQESRLSQNSSSCPHSSVDESLPPALSRHRFIGRACAQSQVKVAGRVASCVEDIVSPVTTCPQLLAWSGIESVLD